MLFFLIPTSTHLTGPAAPQDPWFGGETSVKKLLHPYTAGKKKVCEIIFSNALKSLKFQQGTK